MNNFDAAAENLKRWREAPRGILQYVEEQFGASPDPWQEDALLAFASPLDQYRRISLQACVGPGKTAVLVSPGWLQRHQEERTGARGALGSKRGSVAQAIALARAQRLQKAEASADEAMAAISRAVRFSTEPGRSCSTSTLARCGW